ncbi:sentrin-specific protease, variant 2 [Coprinopsis cinerea AmutBmut pab1-1]|nr:sentrin-specific protease, variant 2 [Coprinopsis cinerea AmutBmut pab1-1]
MNATQKDREPISRLHGLQQTKSFTKPPTRIEVPGKIPGPSKVKREGYGTNPFANVGFVKPNASKKATHSNPSTSRPPKLQSQMKTSGSRNTDSDYGLSGAERPAKRRRSDNTQSNSSPEVIYVSEDDLNIVPQSSQFSSLDEPYTPRPNPPKKPPKFHIAQDGPATVSLINEVEEIEDDPIEDPPSPQPSKRKQQTGNVKEKVQVFENMARKAQPRPDFNDTMRSKRPPPMPSGKNPFVKREEKRTQENGKRKKAPDFLPVKAFCAEDEGYRDIPCRLFWDDKTQKFSLSSLSNNLLLYDLALDQIKTIRYVSLDDAATAAKPTGAIIIVNDDCLIFDDADDEWSVDSYRTFKKFLFKSKADQSSISPMSANNLVQHYKTIPVNRMKPSTKASTASVGPSGRPPDLPHSGHLVEPPYPRPKASTGKAIQNTAVVGPPRLSATEQLAAEQTLRRSSRQAAASRAQEDPDEVVLVYPFSAPGAVNITNADLARLEPGEFLNDTLIEFGLKLWLQRLQETDPALAEQVHVFSSFFYKKLNKKNIEEGYNSVRKWTSKFDLFKKKYVIVPINEHMHWYLALIFEPEHVLRPPPPASSTSKQEDEVPREEEKTAGPRGDDVEVASVRACSIQDPSEVKAEAPRVMDVDASPGKPPPSPTLSYADPDEIMNDASKPGASRLPSPMRVSPSPEIVETSRNPSPPMSTTTDSHPVTEVNDDVEVEADDLNIGPSGISPGSFYGKSSAKQYGKKRPVPKKRRVGRKSDVPAVVTGPLPNTTYVFTLDSLGTPHTHASNQLAKYLKLEAKDKKGIETEVKVIQRRQAYVPTQPNYCDCGLYLLHLAQTFVSNPQFYLEKCCTNDRTTSNAQRQEDWHDHKVPEMRQQLQQEIRKLSQEWQKLKKERPDPKAQDFKDDSDDDIIESVVVAPTKKKSAPVPSTVTTRAQRLR